MIFYVYVPCLKIFDGCGLCSLFYVLATMNTADHRCESAILYIYLEMASCSSGWPQTHNEVEDGFELLTFLPAPSKWWDCSYTSSFLVYLILLKTNPEVRLLDQIGLFLYRQVIKAIGKNLTKHLAFPTHILSYKSPSHSPFICLKMAPL